MIIHVLAFFACASLGTEFRAGAFNENRHDKEIEVFPTGLTVYDINGKLIELTKAQEPQRNVAGKIIFKLYTKQRPTIAQELNVNDGSSLRNGGFDPSKRTYIITHGWISNENSASCALIRDGRLITLSFIRNYYYLQNKHSSRKLIDYINR